MRQAIGSRWTRGPGTCRSAPGLLLLEATITVAVVAVSLIFLTRSFAVGFRALKQTRRHEAVLLLAERKLEELWLAAEVAQPVEIDREGQFSADEGEAAWRFDASPLAVPDRPLELERLAVTVEETGQSSPVRITLTTIVPRSWVPEGW